ncbi:hypothetical protein O6H91_05G045000 [Diphasiastrum complanatum]|uniref:Uncharacterized protein n=1 Tax=Diphasiastrum complanatum TaxID=34168 RepID=A0ACC2DMT1_DIPCM|nr:hypothetical protein O6H91_05G045000 [Diphasiastrum complanatum]
MTTSIARVTVQIQQHSTRYCLRMVQLVVDAKKIKCWNNTQWCNPRNPSVFITATNLCLPNDALPNDNGGW